MPKFTYSCHIATDDSEATVLQYVVDSIDDDVLNEYLRHKLAQMEENGQAPYEETGTGGDTPSISLKPSVHRNHENELAIEVEIDAEFGAWEMDDANALECLRNVIELWTAAWIYEPGVDTLTLASDAADN
jgi:hypothetical protein